MDFQKQEKLKSIFKSSSKHSSVQFWTRTKRITTLKIFELTCLLFLKCSKRIQSQRRLLRLWRKKLERRIFDSKKDLTCKIITQSQYLLSIKMNLKKFYSKFLLKKIIRLIFTRQLIMQMELLTRFRQSKTTKYWSSQNQFKKSALLDKRKLNRNLNKKMNLP